jgi:hypothetical protein
MYQESNKPKPSLQRIASSVVACYYDYNGTHILTGYIGWCKEDKLKKVVIDSASFYENKLPDFVSQEIKKYGFSMWINKSQSLKKALGLSCNEIEFDVTNQMELEELQGLFEGLKAQKRIVVTGDAVLPKNESCSNATKILLRALNDDLWGQPAGRVIAGGKTLQQPFGSPNPNLIRW